MVHLRKFAGVVTVLLMLSAPILACALPGQQMNEEEQTCCLHMADECNGSQMGDSHSCCNKLPQIGASVLQLTYKYAPVVQDAVQTANDLQPSDTIIVAAVIPKVIALPESPPGQSSILRI
jgi:hypothetical protein